MSKVLKFSALSFLAMLLVFSCSKDDSPTEAENHPPNAPTNPSPASGAINQPINLVLDWDCTDPDGDQLFYAIAIVGGDGSQVTDSNFTESSYDLGPLEYGTVYAWAVGAVDEHLAYTIGTGWSFITMAAPLNESPSGPSDPLADDAAIEALLNILPGRDSSD